MADREKISSSELLQRYEAGERDFRGVDLSKANLSGANFRGAIFRGAILNGAILCEADLSRADLTGASFPGAYLARANLSASRLVVAKLWRTHLSGANLSGADLSFADLLLANLSRADLSKADLSKADLSRADLSKADLSETLLCTTQALRTNFENAILTGACIQDWHINSSTNLNGVICEYVYLKYDYEKKELQERRPHSGTFAPGEFTKLFQVSLETVDLIFREGVNWKAVAYSLTNTQVVNEDTPLAIQSVENKGDGTVVIRVNLPSNADKGKIYDDFWRGYEFAQQALESQYQARLEDKDKHINQQYQARLEDKDKHINQLFILVNQLQQQLGEVPKLMAETNKNYTFHGSVGSVGDKNTQSGIAGGVKGDQKTIQHVHNYAPEQKQTLGEAAVEIQNLLSQLQTQGYSPESAQKKIANDLAIKAKNNPEIRDKLTKWGQDIAGEAANIIIVPAVVEVLKLGLRLAGIPIP